MRTLIWITTVLAILWGGYWGVGSRVVKSAAETWFEDQAAAGMVASHQGLTVAGFPNRFDLTVTDVTLGNPVAGVTWKAPFAQIFAMTWKPWHIIAALPHEQTLSLPGETLTLTSTKMRGSLLLVPGTDLALNEVVAELETAALSSSLGWQIGVEKAVASTRLDATQANAHRLGLSVTGLAPDPAFVAVTRLPATLNDIHLDATAKLSGPINRHMADAPPRLIGFDITEARLLWGDLKISAKGHWQADAAGFATGEIAIRIEGWQALPKVLVAMGTISPDFTPTLTKGLEALAKSGPDPKVLTLPLKANDGRLSLGPFPLGPAPNWN